MFGSSWKLGRVAGVEIRIDQSWAIIALLVTYTLYLRFSFLYEDLETGAAAALGVVAAILFFGSVLTHEMAHAVVSIRRGIPVKGITLFLFGGVTHAKVESRQPRDEFLISVVGPLTSLLLAALFAGVATFGVGVLPESVAGAIGYLGWVNLVLALFNLLPGFPLDGGRVLRSIVWGATGSLARATRIASITGQGFGYLLIAGGFLLLVFVPGGLVGGLWIAAIGWFLAQAARASYAEVQVRSVLSDVDAEDVMAAELRSIPAHLTLQEAVDQYFLRFDHGAFPVEEDGRATGLLTLRAVKHVPREEWATRRVRETMAPLDEQITVRPDTPMDQVLSRLQEREAHRVLVRRDGEVVGIITSTDIARWFQRWQAVQERGG